MRTTANFLAATLTLTASLVLTNAIDATQSPRRIEVPNSPSCPRCTIVFTEVANIRYTDGSGRLNIGALFVGKGEVFNIAEQTVAPSAFYSYDRSGKNIGSFGRKGAGPGELSVAYSVAVHPTDSLWVYDYNRNRFTVFAPGSRDFARSFDPPIPIRDWVLLPNRELVVIARVFNAPAHSIVRLSSHGEYLAGVGPIGSRDLNGSHVQPVRIRQARKAGEYWVFSGSAYEIERRDSTGKLLFTVSRNPPWFPSDWRPPSGLSQMPRPTVDALHEDASGHLWVILRIPNERYFRANPDPRNQVGPGAVRVPGSEPAFNYFVEVIDFASGRLLVSQQKSAAENPFVLDNEFAVRIITDSSGFKTVIFGRIGLLTPPE